MEGVNDPPELKGIIPRAFNHIFDMIAKRGGENTEFLVRASYLELYNEEVRDLLSKNSQNKLDLKETPDSGAAWSKWPSWRGHSWPLRAHRAASEGFRLPSALVRRGPALQIPPRGRGPPATCRPSRHFCRV
tara:strand:- start:443 stop:838 length:396 start_codon:yes stop_codon:yes gene_type:complete